MQLISYSFVILWGFVFALYYLVPKKAQWYVLLGASLLFYCIGLRGFPLGLLLTGITTYGCGMYLGKKLDQEKEALKECTDREEKKAVKAVFQKKRKKVQTLTIVFNLGLLVFYKYAVVAVPLVERATGSGAGFLERVIMPLGISFYTLTAIGYIVDAGRENCAVETDLLKILLFLAYFPSVTQGPFTRFKQMKEEFEKAHVFQYDRMLRGIQRFVWGAFKKLVIADRIGIFVDRVYSVDVASVPGGIFACATVLYMLQLYADFSGYIDMAAGVSETLDIMLPDNFRRPYFARSVAEYFKWQIEIEQILKRYSAIVLFGAGNMCRNFIKCYGEKYAPLFTCDNNQVLWGTSFCGLEVKPPEALRSLPEGCAILICNIYYREIEKQLRQMGVGNPIEFFNDEYMPSFYFDRLDTR